MLYYAMQGMSFLACTLLLYTEDVADCFVSLANLLNRRNSQCFFQLQRPAIKDYCRCFDHFFGKFLPLLHRHFRAQR